jgi:ABC-type sugar transport system ATPase subunit
LFNTLFDDTTNSSTEKSIYFNLIDLPPSSWNLSLHTNDSVLLDIILPSPSHATTNLTITNVEANRFSANIIGVPVNLQVDQIQVKEFSLAMNLTTNQTNQSVSDVVIGHVRSERFQLDITKSDNMNIHIQQVDSETAELFFDSQFCTNETNLQINLNLSKNGMNR